jgi:hypothetical protein
LRDKLDLLLAESLVAVAVVRPLATQAMAAKAVAVFIA